jgi:bacillopeptidase F (M6 metalloprotease family)
MRVGGIMPKELRDCWVAHQDGQVALVFEAADQTSLVRLDGEKIANLRRQLDAAETFLSNYAPHALEQV